MAEPKNGKGRRLHSADDEKDERQIAEESRRKGLWDFHPRDLGEQEELRDLSRQAAHDF